MSSDAPLTLFLYTEEKRGNQLVESEIVGSMADISASEQLVVIRDPHSGIKFIYRIDHFSSNLDAVAITELDDAKFDGRHTETIRDTAFRLGPPQSALKFLKGRREWIQDKGSVLSVLLQNAARKNSGFAPRGIQRDRMTSIPKGVAVEYLADRKAAAEQAGAQAQQAGAEASQAEDAASP